MFMQILPSWRVTFRWRSDSIAMNVGEDDLDAFISTLRRNGIEHIKMVKKDPYGAVSDDEIE